MKERTILHSDVNNFFASVKCVTRPELKDKPVAVTGNPKKRTGIILAKSDIAKRFGVQTGQAIWEAKQLCPQLICLPPHYDLYEQISLKLHGLYLDYTDKVEPLGLDECWLDVTGCERYLNKTGIEIANEIREKVKSEFGFTVSVGVSFSKLFAKLGSDLKKPDATTVISRQNFKELVFPMQLNSIVGIGRRLERKFLKMNIKTIGQFVTLPDSFLKEVMTIKGVELKTQLLGLDELPVLSYFKLPPPKSVGNGTTAIFDITKREDIEKTVYFLAEKVSKRLILGGYTSSTIGISVKTNKLKRFGKSRAMNESNSVGDIAREAMTLLDTFWNYTIPVRAVRVRCSSLQKERMQQLSLFDKDESLSKTIVEIEQKYGHIGLASDNSTFINNSKHSQED